ncbi:MAG TPA: chaperone modulator CbpM [Burkholderiales bacterium]|nr:chaperone modulator CbpM [Burkholderiales bacterium]
MGEVVLTGVVVDEAGALSIEQLACACGAAVSWVRELVVEGALVPAGEGESGWRFTSAHLACARRVRRIQRDLDANIDAAIVIVNLLEEIERLQARLKQAGVDLL